MVKITDISINVARKIPKEEAINERILPYREVRDRIYILVSNAKGKYLRELEFVLGKKLVCKEINYDTLIQYIDTVHLGKEVNVEEIIINNSIRNNVSDIHFEPRESSIVVRIRVDGSLRTTYIFTKDEYLKMLSKIKLNSGLDITERRKPQDGKMVYKINNSSYDLRVSIINTNFGEKLVIRLLYGSVLRYSVDKLNLLQAQVDKLEKIMAVSTGLVIVAGPTGSGKTTTLYTILNEINKEDINIATLEDPIEVIIPGINQVNLNKSVGLDFAGGLRSLLRQDPDVLMVGEVRDDETATMAVRASITGHKVFATIHTRDPREVYFRLEDMGIKGYLIRDCLVGIISQRLIKVLCDECKKEHGKAKFNEKTFITYKKIGCSKCHYTGYSGRKLVAAIYYIDKYKKHELNSIYENNKLLTNEEMLLNLSYLFLNGMITPSDYYKFIEMEEIYSENYKIDIL